MLKYYTPENNQLAQLFLPQPLYAVLPFICATNSGKMWAPIDPRLEQQINHNNDDPMGSLSRGSASSTSIFNIYKTPDMSKQELVIKPCGCKLTKEQDLVFLAKAEEAMKHKLHVLKCNTVVTKAQAELAT